MSALSPVRRFYKEATARAVDGGFGIALDERALRTPRGKPFVAPTLPLAEAIASEWQAQGEHVAPATMPLTQLAFAAIDITPERGDELTHTLAKYIETDLVCHRAGAPATLVARQSATWGPIVAWAEERFHIGLPVVTGVAPAVVPPQHLTTLASEIEHLDDFRRTALAQAITLSGSALIGFALLEGRLSAEDAYAAATLDEEWSMANWGEDAEARARLDGLKTDLANTARFISALG